MITHNCPHCAIETEFPDSYAGQETTCARCQQSWVVPDRPGKAVRSRLVLAGLGLTLLLAAVLVASLAMLAYGLDYFRPQPVFQKVGGPPIQAAPTKPDKRE